MKPSSWRLSWLVAIVLVATVEAHQAPRDFQSFYSAYASGDRGVITRSIHTVADLHRLVPVSMQRRIEYPVSSKEPWSRTRALFYVELAAVAIDHKWLPELSVMADAAASYLARRSDRPGQDPDADAFERRCHTIILAAYEGAIAPNFLLRYLNTWIVANKRPDDPQFRLAQAIALEQTFLPSTLVRLGVASESTLLIGTSRPARQLAIDAMVAFKNVSRDESTRAEASIRLGFILYRDAKPADALQYLDVVDKVIDDPALQYWGKLFRGRALDALGRVDEARVQYAEAEAASPGAQSARVALTALNFRTDRRDDALANARTILGAPSDVEDPWLIYWLGQHRFQDRWIADARGKLQ